MVNHTVGGTSSSAISQGKPIHNLHPDFISRTYTQAHHNLMVQGKKSVGERKKGEDSVEKQDLDKGDF